MGYTMKDTCVRIKFTRSGPLIWVPGNFYLKWCVGKGKMSHVLPIGLGKLKHEISQQVVAIGVV